MIDNQIDISASKLRLLVFQALKQYSTLALLPMLKDNDAIVRTAVARELQIRGGQEVFECASNLTGAARFESREIAAFLLGQLGTPSYPFRDCSIPILVPLLQDDYFEVRGSAAAALGHLKAQETVNYLIPLAFDEEPYVRENVAFALSFIDLDEAGISVLKRLSEDDNENVRKWAEFGLEEKASNS